MGGALGLGTQGPGLLRKLLGPSSVACCQSTPLLACDDLCRAAPGTCAAKRSNPTAVRFTTLGFTTVGACVPRWLTT